MKRVLIVDDEPQIRKEIEYLVSLRDEFILVESCGHFDTAKVALQLLKPDLVLLDIQLGNQNAFDLLNGMEDFPFDVIFITAYNEYAIRAIKFGALDYLLKPINEQEFNQALDKVTGQKKKQDLKSAINIANKHMKAAIEPGKMVLRTQQAMHVVDFDDIIFCKSDTSYTTFHFVNKGPVMVSKPIKVYDELLPHQRFIRCHQSYLVNFDFIESYHKEGKIYLKTGGHVPVSERKKEKVAQFLRRER